MTFRNYFNRFSILVAGRLVGALAIFVVNILVVRYLGIEALGTFAIFVSIISILTICLPLGYNALASIFAAEYTATKKPGLLKGFISATLKNLAIVSCLLMLLLAASRLIFPQFVTYENALFGAAVLLTAIATSLLNLNGAIMTGLKQQVAGLLPEMLIRPLLMLAGTFAVLATYVATDLFAVLIIAALASWFAVLFIYFRQSGLHVEITSHKAESDAPRWRKAAYPWMVTSLLWDYMIDLIVLLTAFLSGAAEIAILHICFRYRVLAGFGMRTIFSLLMPEITASKATDNFEEVYRKLAQVNYASLIYAIGVLGVFGLFGDWMLSLFSSEIIYGFPILIIITLTLLVRAVFGPASLILAVHNSHIATALISLAGLAIAVGTILIFFAKYGLLAVAIGYTSANLFVALTLWIYARHKTGIDSSIFGSLFNTQPKAVLNR